jgi:outer membrane protein OmpA-like peptidoglycan-associated protein
VLTTAWANAYGPDAESWMKFTNAGPTSFDIVYSSSRGVNAVRRILLSDRQSARTLVLGFSAKMPLTIENSDTIGISTAVVDELRTTGQSKLALIPDTSMVQMAGNLHLQRRLKMDMLVDGAPTKVPAIQVAAVFARGKKKAQGDLYILDNRNNPLLLEYSLQFSGEKTPRTERIVLVTPGAAERSAMQQALATMRTYTTRGIHFDFDKATIRHDSNDLLAEIATTLRNNPLWTLQITGHTDDIGKADYNQKLSEKRAESIKAALVAMGIAPQRLTTVGAGASQPVSTNKTLEGRAQNRRVVLMRTDR